MIFARSATVLTVLFVALSTSSYGYSLGDHRMITRQAHYEFNHCHGGFLTEEYKEILLDANIGEDTNLFRKFFKYSHYYHPHKELDIWRKTSMDRIEDVLRDINKEIFQSPRDMEEILTLLGGAIHHLQDSTSPLHVVPVKHGLGDTYENYDLNGHTFPGSIPPDCEKRVFTDIRFESLDRLLQKSAAETYSKTFEPLYVKRGEEELQLNWQAFWQEASDNGYGRYGYLGNRFGEEWITRGQNVFHVSKDQYDRFKSESVRAAIDHTIEALVWLKHQLERF